MLVPTFVGVEGLDNSRIEASRRSRRRFLVRRLLVALKQSGEHLDVVPADVLSLCL
jgi:hypothetical protein